MDISILAFKTSLDSLFSKFGLSMSRIGGQGYDGASNMWEEWNDLQVLFVREFLFSYYIQGRILVLVPNLSSMREPSSQSISKSKFGLQSI